METVKVAVIGIGNVGSAHAVCVAENEIIGMSLTAVCDISENKITAFSKNTQMLSAIQTMKNYLKIKSVIA